MFTSKQIADTYDQIGLHFSLTRPRLSAEVISLLPALPQKSRVLDLGCGNGVLLTTLPHDIAYLGLDISPALLAEAKRRHPGTNFLLGDVLDQKVWDRLGPLPAGGQEFDLIVALALFHHLPTPADHTKLLRNIKQHLKSSGSALISVWRLDLPKFDRFRTNGKHFSIPFHGGPTRDFYAFTDDELESLCRQTGFSQTKITNTKENLYLTLGL